MKKWQYIPIIMILISIGASVTAHAKSMKDVIGTYSLVTAYNKLWIQGLGTDTDTTYNGKITIKSNKIFDSFINDTRIKGKCKIAKEKLVVIQNNSLRNQFGEKVIKPWCEEWIRDLGSSISNLSVSYTKFKITPAPINENGPVKLNIYIDGIGGGYVMGEGYVYRDFKYKCTIIFNGRD